MLARQIGRLTIVCGMCVCSLFAQVAIVRGHVEVAGGAGKGPLPATVVWLTPSGGSTASDPKESAGLKGPFRLVQKNKSFEPQVLVIPVGAVVDFPNRDPFFHNVFSLFEGKRFDLGLYEAGTSRMVHFDRPGVSYIFCNIHPEMKAVVIAVTTPYYAVSNKSGQISIPNVPFGKYTLHIWSEQRVAEYPAPETREINVGEESYALGTIRVPASDGHDLAHKNKYGRDYDSVSPDNPVYHQQ